jgi:ketosteroid isomerase-like protein
MSAETPEEICRLFQRHMREGDIDAMLALYDPSVAFRNRSGEVRRGKEELREELLPFAAARASFEFDVLEVIQAGDVALTHTKWRISTPAPVSLYVLVVARRQPDGTWRWVIGDPYTIGSERPNMHQG